LEEGFVYLPPMGLAAAMTAHRACREVMMPALEMEMDCCSIASWIEVRSESFILSNSSIKHTPWMHTNRVKGRVRVDQAHGLMHTNRVK
jgi:hypothetical protein